MVSYTGPIRRRQSARPALRRQLHVRALCGQQRHNLEHRRHDRGRESGRSLVRQHQLRIRHRRGCDRRHLLLTAGQPAGTQRQRCCQSRTHENTRRDRPTCACRATTSHHALWVILAGFRCLTNGQDGGATIPTRSALRASAPAAVGCLSARAIAPGDVDSAGIVRPFDRRHRGFRRCCHRPRLRRDPWRDDRCHWRRQAACSEADRREQRQADLSRPARWPDAHVIVHRMGGD